MSLNESKVEEEEKLFKSLLVLLFSSFETYFWNLPDF